MSTWLESIWTAVAEGQRPTWADFEWHAVDQHGRIGIFTTGGSGPIPKSVFGRIETYIKFIDWLEELPEDGSHRIIHQYPKMQSFIEAADRGLYAFDFDDADYRCVAIPTKPARINDFPLWARAWLETTRIGADFAQVDVIDLSRIDGGLT